MEHVVVVGGVRGERFGSAVEKQFAGTVIKIHNILFDGDLRSVIDKTKETIGNLLQYNNNEIVLLGRSGGGYAVMQALKELKEDNFDVDKIKKIILQCTPISYDDLKLTGIEKIGINRLPFLTFLPKAKFAKDIQKMGSIKSLINEYKNKIIYHYAKDDEVINNHLVTNNIIENVTLIAVPSVHNFVVDGGYDFINNLTKEAILKAFEIS